MRVSHHPDYFVGLPESHPFPMAKYVFIRQILLERGLITAQDIVEPCEATLESLARVHTPAYLEKLSGNLLTPAEQRKIGVPWSAALWRRAKLSTQGTLDAARRSLSDGIGANLAGGTHHAFPDHGEGFCVLNDVAISIRTLQAEGVIRNALVIDLDVHQGNGTAAIFENDPSVFTFSMHGAKNYPVHKERSSLDIELHDGTDDVSYLATLRENLTHVMDRFQCDMAFYIAGVDVAAGDRYGRLALTDDGIRARDRLVIGESKRRGFPLVLTMAGGYAETPLRTAQLHAIVFEEALAAQ